MGKMLGYFDYLSRNGASEALSEMPTNDEPLLSLKEAAAAHA
jgi:hypothetical protein